MNILNKLFGNSKSTQVEVQETTLIPSAELFTESAPPSFPSAKPKTAIAEFLLRNFLHEGRIEGYNTHASDGLPGFIHQLRSDFRLAVRQDMLVLDDKMLDLQDCLTNIEGLLPSAAQNIQRRYDALKQRFENLETEMIVCEDNEGQLAGPVTHYTNGYRRGVADYYFQQDYIK